MSERLRYLKAVIFDWAGTTVDYGSCAPAAVFQRLFRERGIDITAQQAREPMGMAKREHIATIGRMPSVHNAWLGKYGKTIDELDIDAMYRDFLPMQKEVLDKHATLIPGAAAAIEKCRSLGLKIGSSTGYTHELMQVVSAAAKQQGYVPECVICAEDAPRGRPAPYLLFEAAKQMDVYPMWSIVNVDDTPVGVEAGRHAGCWTVGVTLSGNCVGLSQSELQQRSESEIEQLCAAADKKLRDAGAHFTVRSIAELPELLRKIESLAAQGKLPVEAKA